MEVISKFPGLAEVELKKLVEEDNREKNNMTRNYRDTKPHISPLGIFNSDCQIHSNKESSFKFLYHIINRYIRNYFTHINNFFDDSISSRFSKGLLEQMKTISNFGGEAYRWVGYELNYQIGDIMEFPGFVVATTNKLVLNLNCGPLY
jgi:hypothetical protein